MLPLVSTRISLAWPPAPPQEETDTLVLSGRTGLFLDLRVFVTGARVGEVDWATAGQKQIVSGSEEDGNVRASFIPFINSRAGISSQDEDEDEDEGLFRELENGDVLEVGSIRNPATGLVQEYEEVWRRILQAPENEASVVIIERVASNEPRALVGRIGAWEVGMRDASPTEPFMAWRCDQDEVTGEWKEVYSIGGEVARIRRLIPRIPPLVSPSRGEKLVLAGKEWLVRENS